MDPMYIIYKSTSLTVWGPTAAWFLLGKWFLAHLSRKFVCFKLGGRPTTPTKSARFQFGKDTFHWCVLFTWPYALFLSAVCIASTVCNIDSSIFLTWFVNNMCYNIYWLFSIVFQRFEHDGSIYCTVNAGFQKIGSHMLSKNAGLDGSDHPAEFHRS